MRRLHGNLKISTMYSKKIMVEYECNSVGFVYLSKRHNIFRYCSSRYDKAGDITPEHEIFGDEDTYELAVHKMLLGLVELGYNKDKVFNLEIPEWGSF